MTTLFVALGTVLLVCLVALGALVKTNPRGAVSSFEHLIEGSVGLAVVLYGLVLLYGITRSTNLAAVVGYTPVGAPGAIAIAVALIVLGLCGTLGVFPLRQWVGRVATNVPAGAAGFIVADEPDRRRRSAGPRDDLRVSVPTSASGGGSSRSSPRVALGHCVAERAAGNHGLAAHRPAGQRAGGDAAPRPARIRQRVARASRLTG